MSDDQHIIDLCLDPSSKEEGFRKLMSAYQERLYWVIRRMLHNHPDTDDVLQNTMIKAYRFIDTFNQKSSLHTWLYRIATNESLTFINKKKKRQTLSTEEMSEQLGQELKADPYFNGDDMVIALKQAIETLPEKQKAVFNLRYYEEMSYKEMSSVLETSEGALKASYHHAAKKIEEHLKNYE
jgi:RNA polymerase sigma-70 factor (ECF subfamily)